MISLRKREHISIESARVIAPTELEKPGMPLPGLLLAALFILSICCRYGQALLLSSIQFGAPITEWSPPDATLLLLPASVVAIPIGYFCRRKPRFFLIACLAAIGCALATINYLLAKQVMPAVIVSAGVVALTVCIEAGRISILTQVAGSTQKRNVNSVSASLMLIELAACILAIDFFKQTAEFLPMTDGLRIVALVTASFSLLYAFLSKQPASESGDTANRQTTDRLSALEQLKIYPLTYIGLAVATNASILFLLAMTLAGKVVASIALSSLWYPSASGMLCGAAFCLIPWTKLQSARSVIAIALAIGSSVLCIFKPTGTSLVIGLALSGVAAATANITCCTQLCKLRYPNFAGVLFGCQAALTSVVSLTFALVLEPKIESLSSFVFIRVVSISQILLLVGFGTISYIIFKYRRTQA